jgi:serine/threonine protein kinase/tetratricopeptide (TPR) repeat protein
MNIAPGVRLGPYEVVTPLGAGGMGEVWRARDTRLGREVAIKVLPAAFVADPAQRARIEREARTISNINHPHICTLHDVGREGDVDYLVFELVVGQTLSDLITPVGLPLAHVLELAIPLADALVAAHEQGVIHRDLKPGNVMVTREGRVKVLDFGLAKIAGEEGSAASVQAWTVAAEPLSGAGQVLGTIPYMAPEQLRGEAVDARSDLFALGIILYELATGRRPFGGRSSVEVSSAILRDTPEPMPPGELERLVSRCLEKNPRERPQTALDVSNELRAMRRTLERGAASAKPAPDQAASIAVLPFANRSGDVNDEYFSDGLADELLNVLAKIKGLRVTARTSSFHFKGKDTTIAEVGKTLGVATVLEGSVRKAGNRIRVAVQLVRVSDSSHLWSESYDRTLDDIFAVQDDIAQSVVKELRTTLLGETPDSDASGQAKAEVAQAAKGRATDPEAHQLYLQAKYFGDHINREDTPRAIEYLEQALTLDPEFALAWAELGRMFAREAGFGWVPVDEGFRKAREAAMRALSLEPDLAEGHAQMAFIQINHDWDWPAAEHSLRRAMELAPGNDLVLRRAGHFANVFGRIEEAIRHYHSALARDPLNVATWNSLGGAYRAANRLEQAANAFRKAKELVPGTIFASALLSLVLAVQGKGEEALAEAANETAEVYRLWALAIVQHTLGRRTESDEALRVLIEKYAEGFAYQIAQVRAERRETDAAFEWLERAYEQRDAGLAMLKSSTEFRNLYGDPRWPALIRKMGLEGSE